MEYFANFPGGTGRDPRQWGQQMEAAGWHGLCASDHFWTQQGYPHVWVTASALALSTSRVQITTSFANNLFRSPVEFAQASHSLNRICEGRFQAGLGAGWMREEVEKTGLDFPTGKNRLKRYVEAITIARDLLRNGVCSLDGEFYQVDMDVSLEMSDPPPVLIGSAGQPGSIAAVAPLVDVLEIPATTRATVGGVLDFVAAGKITTRDITADIERARLANPDIPLGLFLFVACGETEVIQQTKQVFGEFLGNFMGPPPEVAEALRRLEELGIDRVQLTEIVPGSLEALGPALF